MLTDDDRKLLTEFLGECWHESRDGRAVGKIKLSGGISIQTCYKCKAVMSDSYHGVNENRTFTAWQDTGDLKKKIVEMGEWVSFCLYAFGEFTNAKYSDTAQLIDWLMNPIRFPELVAGGLKERRKG